jgi:preprotein translocase subunit SecA
MFNWLIKKILGSKNQRTVRKLQPTVIEINRIEEQLQQQDEQALRDRVAKWQAAVPRLPHPTLPRRRGCASPMSSRLDASLEGIAPYFEALKAHFPSLDAEEVKTSAWASASLEEKKARIDRARDAWNEIQPKFDCHRAADAQRHPARSAYAVVKNAARRLCGREIIVCDHAAEVEHGPLSMCSSSAASPCIAA